VATEFTCRYLRTRRSIQRDFVSAVAGLDATTSLSPIQCQLRSFDEIELLIIGGGGGDAIAIIARDNSYNGAADGVQDFTASVDTGPEILYIDQATLTVDALAGSDQVTLETPAPNNAVWDVEVTVNGRRALPRTRTADRADSLTLLVPMPRLWFTPPPRLMAARSISHRSLHL
jgi:hypothetical protein